MSNILALTFCVLALAVEFSFAIQCFTCQDRTSNCVAGIMTSCQANAQYCKLEWTASNDVTVQSCATSMDCPASSAMRKRQVGRSFVGEDGSPIGNIMNCCNYDGCNCIGPQCDTIMAGASLPSLDRVTVATSVLFATLLSIRQ